MTFVSTTFSNVLTKFFFLLKYPYCMQIKKKSESFTSSKSSCFILTLIFIAHQKIQFFFFLVMIFFKTLFLQYDSQLTLQAYFQCKTIHFAQKIKDEIIGEVCDANSYEANKPSYQSPCSQTYRTCSFFRKLEVSDDTPTYQPMIRIHLLFLMKRLDFFQRLLQKKHVK